MRTGAIDLSIRNSRRIVYCGVANGEDEEWGKCPPLSITQLFFVFVFEGVLIFVNIGQCHLPPVARGAGASRAVLRLFLPAPFA